MDFEKLVSEDWLLILSLSESLLKLDTPFAEDDSVDPYHLKAD